MPAIAAGLAFAVAGAALAYWSGMSVLALAQPFRRRGAAPQTAVPREGVTVLVPVRSPAPDLAGCVESLRRLTWPDVDVVLATAVDDAPAIAATRREATLGPVRVQAIAVLPVPSPNPKIAVLAPTLAHARHDLILFTDDNSLSPPDRIESHLARMSDGCGLVSAAVVGIGAANFWGEVDAAFMNGQFAKMQLAGDCIGIGGVIGKSMLARRSDIERSGGLLATGATLCEDGALQVQLARIGCRTGVCASPMTQRIGSRAMTDVWSRHRRWYYCRSRSVPGGFAVEAIVSSPVTATCASMAMQAVGWPWWAGALIASAALLCVEMAFLAMKRWPIGWRYPLVWLTREMLVAPLWLAAVFGGHVVWRGRRLRLGDPAH